MPTLSQLLSLSTIAALGACAGSLAISPATLPDATVGEAYEEQITFTGAPTSITASCEAPGIETAVDDALDLIAFTGTPTEAGEFDVRIDAESIGFLSSSGFGRGFALTVVEP